MADPRDSLDALAGASAKKKTASSYRHQLALQQAQRRRQQRIKLFAIPLVLLVVGIAIFVAFKFIQPPAPPPPPQVEAEQPSAGQAEHRVETQAAWSRVRQREQTPAYKPLLERGESQAATMDEAWSSGRYVESAAAMDALLRTIQEIEALDRSREAALVARQDAKALADQAASKDAQTLVPTLLAESQSAFDAAARRFEADEFEAATDGWRSAAEAYGRATVATETAKAAGEARKSYQERLVARFDQATIEAHGGAPLEEAIAKLATAEAAYRELRFDEARGQFEQAQQFIPQIEQNVQRQIGAHYYALLAGYRAADLLLQQAVGDPPGESRWNSLHQTLEDLLLPAEFLALLEGARDANYSTAANVLMEQTAAAIAQSRGGELAASFAIGVQVRLIEKMLDTDADAFARTEAMEIRRSAAAIEKQAQAAGYPSGLDQALSQLAAALAIKPEYAAIRKAREIWTSLIRQLEDYEGATKLLPVSGARP